MVGIMAVALATSAVATAEGAGAGAGALVAKKCKKKRAGAAKKKKCRKRQPVVAAPAVPVSPQPSQQLRATLTWAPNASAVTLEAFDQAGAVGYFGCNVPDCANSEGGNLGNVKWSGIPNNGGPIKLTDLSFLAGSARQFSYRICLFSPSAGSIATLDYVTADGASHHFVSNMGALDDANDGVNVVPPGGFDPATYAPRPHCQT
jgi:hypothetical protein